MDQGFKEKVYPINPSATEILGLKAYPSVKDVPDEVDVACIILPNTAVPSAVEECGQKGVKGVIIYAGGFAEIGEKGAELQRIVTEIASKYGLRILGPNINGMFNGSISLNASFNQFKTLEGPASIVSQSGSFASGIVFESIRHGFGFSKFIILGNRADVDEVEALEYLEEDQQTKGIALYLESIKDEESFVRVASRVSRKKPIVFIKGGVTSNGTRAIKYTTASHPKGDPSYSEVAKRAGLIVTKSAEELVDALFTLIHQPPPKGKRVGIVTNSGGIAVIMTDRLEEGGLVVPELSGGLREKLSKVVPPFGSTANPVDLTGSVTYEMFRDSLITLIDSDEVDVVAAVAIRSLFVPLEVFEKSFSEAGKEARRVNKPFVCCVMGDDRIFELFSSLRSKGIPCYPTPDRAARALIHLYEYSLVKGTS